MCMRVSWSPLPSCRHNPSGSIPALCCVCVRSYHCHISEGVCHPYACGGRSTGCCTVLPCYAAPALPAGVRSLCVVPVRSLVLHPAGSCGQSVPMSVVAIVAMPRGSCVCVVLPACITFRFRCLPAGVVLRLAYCLVLACCPLVWCLPAGSCTLLFCSSNGRQVSRRRNSPNGDYFSLFLVHSLQPCGLVSACFPLRGESVLRPYKLSV